MIMINVFTMLCQSVVKPLMSVPFVVFVVVFGVVRIVMKSMIVVVLPLLFWSFFVLIAVVLVLIVTPSLLLFELWSLPALLSFLVLCSLLSFLVLLMSWSMCVCFGFEFIVNRSATPRI